MQPLKHAEQLVRISHVEAGTIVAHEERVRLAVGHADFDAGALARAGVFPGVAEQILERDRHQSCVAFAD